LKWGKSLILFDEVRVLGRDSYLFKGQENKVFNEDLTLYAPTLKHKAGGFGRG
jgi:hypothetical protein